MTSEEIWSVLDDPEINSHRKAKETLDKLLLERHALYKENRELKRLVSQMRNCENCEKDCKEDKPCSRWRLK